MISMHFQDRRNTIVRTFEVLTHLQLGIFLCMRCAALHRKLGTHISKVKSLSMDKWDNAQVDVGQTEEDRLNQG